MRLSLLAVLGLAACTAGTEPEGHSSPDDAQIVTRDVASFNEPVEAYGLAHEAELWAEFQPQMDGTDYSKWLYNGGDVTASSTRPADLGYFVGARIVESYYKRATNKHAAIQEILCIRDYHVFLAASGYTGQP